MTTKLAEKRDHCTQLEQTLKEYKEKHLNLEQKAEALEGQIKVSAKQMNGEGLGQMFPRTSFM